MNVRVVKFGGSIVVDPAHLRRAARSLLEAPLRPTLAVASAPRGWTDQLLALARSETSSFPPAAEDRVLALAEEAGAALLAGALEAEGASPRLLRPDDPGWPLRLSSGDSSDPIDLDRTTRALERLFASSDGPTFTVMPGFVGRTASGGVRTQARGGGDTTAVVVARCLGSEEVVLVKDVPGVLAGDPRVLPEAAVLERISVGDLEALAEGGASVVASEAIRHLAPAQRLRVVRLGDPLDGGARTRVERRAPARRGFPGAPDGRDLHPPAPRAPAAEPCRRWALVTGIVSEGSGSEPAGSLPPRESDRPNVRIAPARWVAPQADAEDLVGALHGSGLYRAVVHRPLETGRTDRCEAFRPDAAETGGRRGLVRRTVRPPGVP